MVNRFDGQSVLLVFIAIETFGLFMISSADSHTINAGTYEELSIYTTLPFPCIDLTVMGLCVANRDRGQTKPTAKDYQKLEKFIAQKSVKTIEFEELKALVPVRNQEGDIRNRLESQRIGQKDLLSVANIVRRYSIRSFHMRVDPPEDIGHPWSNYSQLLQNYYNNLGNKIAEIITPNRYLRDISIPFGHVAVEYNLANHPAIQAILERNRANSLSNWGYIFFS